MFFLVSCSGSSYQSNFLQSGKISKSRKIPAETLPSLKLEQTKEVQYSLKYFTKIDPKYIQIAKRNKQNYNDDIIDIFNYYKIPLELINIGIVESKFNPQARSIYGAKGIWQFMPTTAKHYGLEVSWINDERKDPLKSTEAAARMLLDLYEEFEDWHYVLAAYNSGQSRIRNIRRQHPEKDFWELARAKIIPSQTKAFVSRVIALTILETHKQQL